MKEPVLNEVFLYSPGEIASVLAEKYIGDDGSRARMVNQNYIAQTPRYENF